MIPQIVHVAWVNTQNLDNVSLYILKNGYRNIKPPWSVQLWNNTVMKQYIFDSSLLSNVDKKILQKSRTIEFIDLFRLLIIYDTGGIWMDIDRLVNKNLSNIVTSKTKLLLPIWQNKDFAQDCFGSFPKNPMIKAAIVENLARRRSLTEKHTNKDIVWMGPGCFLHIVSEWVYGQRILPNLHGPSYRNDEMRSVFKLLQNYDTIATKLEHSSCNTIVYNGNGCNEISKDKRMLYRISGITYWQNEYRG